MPNISSPKPTRILVFLNSLSKNPNQNHIKKKKQKKNVEKEAQVEIFKTWKTKNEQNLQEKKELERNLRWTSFVSGQRFDG